MDSTSNFMKEIRQSRNMVWVWCPFGLIINMTIIGIVDQVIGESPNWLFLLLNVLWCVVFYILLRRFSRMLSKLICPECGHQAMQPDSSNPFSQNKYLSRNIFMSMKDIQCRVCGYQFK